MASNSYSDQVLREMARALSPEQRQLLDNLSERGPGLLLELAVRQLSFPEQISAPLNELRERGLVRAEPFGGGQLGGELYYITADGRQVVGLLREVSHYSSRRVCLRLEANCLEKLGDLAARAGDFVEATNCYRQALAAIRQLAPTCATQEIAL
jgi:hypothetical protein